MDKQYLDSMRAKAQYKKAQKNIGKKKWVSEKTKSRVRTGALVGVTAFLVFNFFTGYFFQGILPAIRRPPLRTSHFLADIDYFHHVLTNNFGAMDVLYRADGVDVNAIVESMREEVLANRRMNVDEFFTMLSRKTDPMINTGHFMMLSPVQHYEVLNVHNWPWLQQSSVRRLTYPHVLAFYEPRHPTANCDVGAINAIRWAETASEARVMQFVNRLVLFGESELADDISDAFLNGDTHELAFLRMIALERIDNVPNIETASIEEGRIAYLSVNSFMVDHTSMFEHGQIFTFYRRIQEYDHLIIDIRRNLGGNLDYFFDAIFRPNIPSAVFLNSLVFITSGYYTREAVNVFSRNFTNFIMNPGPAFHTTYSTFIPVDEMLGRYHLPALNMTELNIADIERMDYAFRISMTVNPETSRTGVRPAFDGKIWLLTGSGTGSATELAARFAKNTGFATLVGERTGGNYGGSRIFVPLPNSGIVFQFDLFYITDNFGRSFEAGTYPHHFNREGYDALETVLQLIAEGEF